MDAKRKWTELPLAQRAAIRCRDPVFWRFLEERAGAPVHCEAEAARWLRQRCAISSRSEIWMRKPSLAVWMDIDDKFQAWKLAAKIGVPT